MEERQAIKKSYKVAVKKVTDLPWIYFWTVSRQGFRFYVISFITP